MKLKIVSVGSKAPSWVESGFREYAKRMPREIRLELVEIPAPKHVKDSGRHKLEEGQRLLGHCRDGDWVVALDERGPQATSAKLAQMLEGWVRRGTDLAFVIGGADGLADGVHNRANETISLSKLTFPHYMVRVILAEALYRAWSIRAGHPYHRA